MSTYARQIALLREKLALEERAVAIGRERAVRQARLAASAAASSPFLSAREHKPRDLPDSVWFAPVNVPAPNVPGGSRTALRALQRSSSSSKTFATPEPLVTSPRRRPPGSAPVRHSGMHSPRLTRPSSAKPPFRVR